MSYLMPITTAATPQRALDFDKARRRALRNALLGRVMGRPLHLLSFSDVQRDGQMKGQRYLGIRQVAVASIAGSVNRSQDFDRDFNPAADYIRLRWVRLNQAIA